MTDPATDPIAIALREDLGEGDITTQFFVRSDLRALGRIVARERAIVAGTVTAAEVFRRVNPKLTVEILQPDGTALSGGETILEVRGAAGAILTAERVALNFLQRLCGIATLTRQFVEAIGKSRAKILDTRKTTPGWRVLEKYAVRAGGGNNHRMDLASAILIKDNHLAACDGDVALAVRRARDMAPAGMHIEVECESPDQVRAAVEAGAHIVLLDNMSLDQLRESVSVAAGRVKTEASGGVNLSTVRAIAETGVDWISIGALTHSPPALNLALDFD